jgi:integrase
LFKVRSKNGLIWHARFWDESLQKYAYSRTTGILVEGKKERRREAEEAAKIILTELAVQKSATPAVQGNRALPFTQQNKSDAVADMPLIQYLTDFWTPDSEYARFKRNVKKKPLSAQYIENNHEDIRRHVEPFPGFAGITVGSLSKALLKKWLIWLSGRKTIRRKKDGTVIEGDAITGRRANIVIQAVRVAIRWAVDNEEIPIDPFRKLGEIAETAKEKGVLTLEERNTLITAPVTDYRSRLVMLLGCLCSMRRGEMRGLQWGDIEDGIITIRHNYQNKEGVKPPKYESIRKVPIPASVRVLLETAREYAQDTTSNGFILESLLYPGKPVSNNFFRYWVAKELFAIGITMAQQKERDLTPHSLRHTFITLAQLAGIADVEIRALAGHKDAAVMQKYSHVPQVIDFDKAREKIEASVDVMKEHKVSSE